MRKISIWAREHVLLARLFIVTGIVLINLLAIITGRLLFEISIEIPTYLFFAAMVMCIIAAVYYPKKHGSSQKRKDSYSLQKSLDIILYMATFLLVAFIANRPSEELLFNIDARATNPALIDPPKKYKTVTDFKASLKNAHGKQLKWKERKKLLKQQVSAVKKANDLTKGQKIALIVLSVLVAAGLSVGLAGLACNISCSGAEALAIVVLIAGLVGITLLTIWVIRKINGKSRKTKSGSGGNTGTNNGSQ